MQGKIVTFIADDKIVEDEFRDGMKTIDQEAH